MSQWTSIYYNGPQSSLGGYANVTQLGADDLLWLHPDANDQTLKLVNELRLKIPEFAFTIDVDILGNHRVTVHFGGGEILIDE